MLRASAVIIALAASSACAVDAPVSGGTDCRNPRLVDLSRTDLPVRVVARVRQIPTAAGDSAASFGAIADVTLDARSRVYVADGMVRTVSVFDADGRLLRRLGRAGDGPGEFRAPVRVRVTAGDTLTVFDVGHWRTSVYDSAGALVRTETPLRGGDPGEIPEVDFDADGRLYNLSYEGHAASLVDAPGRTGTGLRRGVVQLSLWDAERAAWRPLAPVPGPEAFLSPSGGLRRPLFARRPLWRARPEGGVWYADSDEYTIRFAALEGPLQCLVRVAYPALPVSDEERDEYYSAADARTPAQAARLRERRKDIPAPRTKPPLLQIAAGSGGDVWVEVRRVGRQGSVWHVFDREGRPRIAVELPPRFQLKYIAADLLAGVDVDSLGIHTVGLYRLSGGPAPDR